VRLRWARRRLAVTGSYVSDPEDILDAMPDLPEMKTSTGRVNLPALMFHAIIKENQRLTEANHKLRRRGSKAPKDAVERLAQMEGYELAALLTGVIQEAFRDGSWEAAVITEAAGRVIDLVEAQHRS
jgi:hypothetical protein